MKKLATVLFILFAVVSNAAIASEECHPEKEHCEHH